MKIFLTGAAGFIGAKTSEILLQSGNTVSGVDNLNDYYNISIKKYRLENLEKHSSFIFNKCDIENIDEIDKILKQDKFDAIINLAARAGVRYSLVDPHVYARTNAHGTLNLLELMRKHDIPKLITASTSSLYAGQKMPFSEDLPVNEPLSPYAASKKASEMYGYSYNHLYGLDVCVLRYFTVYGPAGRPDMSYFRFIKWIDEGTPLELFGDGTQSRDFTYIDDIASGTIKALNTSGFNIINLGGGNNPQSINYMIELIEENLGKKATIDYKPFHKADMMTTWADISRAKEILDWQPTVQLEVGIAHCVGWYKDNYSWIKNISL
jgi:UDP-glucuronate 4-epimerase